jgi:hypothetical protein
MDIKKQLRESLQQLDLFHLQDALFQHFSLDEAEDPIELEMRDIISDIHLLNYITGNPDKFLRYAHSKMPRKKALYHIVYTFLHY